MELVEGLKLQRTLTTEYGIVMGTGDEVRSQGICQGVVLRLSEIIIEDDFLPLELGSIDVILGMQWLQKMGTMKVNWRSLSMTLESDGQIVEIKGNPALTRAELSLKMMTQSWEEEDQGFVIEFKGLNLNQTDSDTEYSSIGEDPEWAPELKRLREDYEDIFEEPGGLPLVRETDHRIPLKEGTNPINVRPYKYAHIQKNEIERLVSEMLQSGIIRPSHSPYSSPVLLVKKKDGGGDYALIIEH